MTVADESEAIANGTGTWAAAYSKAAAMVAQMTLEEKVGSANPPHPSKWLTEARTTSHSASQILKTVALDS